MLPRLTLILVLAGFSVRAQDTAKIADIKRFMSLVGAEKMTSQMMAQVRSQMPPNMPPNIMTLLDDFVKQETEHARTLSVSLYDKYFTDEDIRGMLQFYESPTGKKVLDVLPQLMSETMTLMMQDVQKFTEKLKAQQRQAGQPAR